MTKALLILAYLLLDHGTVSERIASLGLSAGLLVFLALYGFFAALLFLTAYIRSHWLRVTFAVLLTAGSIFQQSYEWTTAAPLTYEAFINMIHSSSEIDLALAQHGHVLKNVVPLALLLFAGIALPPGIDRKFQHWIPAGAAAAAPFASFLALTLMLYARGGEGSRALPAAIPPLSYAGLMVYEDIAHPSGPRQPVSIAHGQPVTQGDIVLLVDESVAGNYLDINNRNGVRSGLGSPPPDIRAVNFGYAASIHDCSANSNVGLRYGGTRDNYQQTIAHYPSIWAYARQAGMRTVYLDAQSTGGELMNMMTQQEKAEIDDFIQFDDVPVIDRDMAIQKRLSALLANGRREFIYVNKVGAHFPIQDKFPDGLTTYRPVMARGSNTSLSWSSDRTGFNGTPAEWVRYRNSYRNTLLWNVGVFFDRLWTASSLSGATVIYTSDHGQDLHERGNPGNNTHCGAENPMQEVGLVPLVVLENQADTRLDFTSNAHMNHDGMSHFRIFPTLLALMGYDRAQVKELYGPALDEPEKDPFSFNRVFNTQLGRDPVFQTIDRGGIVDPPTSDFSKLTSQRKMDRSVGESEDQL